MKFLILPNDIAGDVRNQDPVPVKATSIMLKANVLLNVILKVKGNFPSYFGSLLIVVCCHNIWMYMKSLSFNNHLLVNVLNSYKLKSTSNSEEK